MVERDEASEGAPSSFGLFSFLSPNRRPSMERRPRSAMAFLSTPVKGKKSVDERGNIIGLLRRASGADLNSRSESPSSSMQLPDHALVGLSEAEREHIRKVLANANRSSASPDTSRRYLFPEFIEMREGIPHSHSDVIIAGARRRLASSPNWKTSARMRRPTLEMCWRRPSRGHRLSSFEYSQETALVQVLSPRPHALPTTMKNDDPPSFASKCKNLKKRWRRRRRTRE